MESEQCKRVALQTASFVGPGLPRCELDRQMVFLGQSHRTKRASSSIASVSMRTDKGKATAHMKKRKRRKSRIEA